MNQPELKRREITRMLREWSDGKREALDELMPLVYEELHRQAARYLHRESQGHTLQTTALIHEAYLKLVDQRKVILTWRSAAAAKSPPTLAVWTSETVSLFNRTAN